VLSVYVDIDAVRLYRAGKASCWHARVLLAAPTVVHAEQNSKFKQIIEVTQTFAQGESIFKTFKFCRSGPARQNDFVLDDGRWMMTMVDNAHHCGGIFFYISTQTSATLCTIG
jgi:hypothetical protein